MKIRMIKKATVLMMSVVMVFATATGALAVAYQAGINSWGPENYMPTAMQEYYYGGTQQAIRFTPTMAANIITGPGGDSLLNNLQTISGIYTLTNVSGGTLGLYDLHKVSGGTSTITVNDGGDPVTTFFSATATALQINFSTHEITWSDVTNVSISNTLTPASEVLTGLAAATSYAFTTFTFQTLGTESAWLSGNTGLSYSAKYYSNLEGFAAAPEPAEWMLMLIGLGMLVFYLQRRGYLNFDLSPQSVA